MWNRKEIKSRGKIAFKANYWKSVLVSIILIAIAGGLCTAVSSGTDSKEISNMFAGMTDAEIIKVAGALMGIILIAGLIGFVLKIFVMNPIEVGCTRFFLENSKGPANLGEIGYAFKNCYKKVVGSMFLRNIFIVLWSFLFLIPGMVKTYSYRMVPYIIADDPEIGAKDAITKSREMMKGNKWKAFVLDLSFIGWEILGGFTAGILNILYVNPYKNATDAELYNELKK